MKTGVGVITTIKGHTTFFVNTETQVYSIGT